MFAVRLSFWLPHASEGISVAAMNRLLRFTLPVLALAAALIYSGCAKKERELHARIQTSMGLIVVKLFEEKTPKTVENFVGLATGKKTWRRGEERTVLRWLDFSSGDRGFHDPRRLSSRERDGRPGIQVRG